jgi:hypothetical protein
MDHFLRPVCALTSSTRDGPTRRQSCGCTAFLSNRPASKPAQLGQRRRHLRRDTAYRSRPRPPRQRPPRPGRRAVHGSDDFRRRWSAHNVRYHGAGTKHFHHHDVGDLELAYESVDMISEPGLTLTLYAAEPGSATAHALDLLASWTAVIDDAIEDAHQPT